MIANKVRTSEFEVHMQVKIFMLFFWVVTLCGLLGGYQCFGGTFIPTYRS
jgi:hypothetical protein